MLWQLNENCKYFFEKLLPIYLEEGLYGQHIMRQIHIALKQYVQNLATIQVSK